VGEPFGLGASFGMNNACCGLEDTFDLEHNLVDTPLEGCRDVLIHKGSPSLACDNVLPSCFGDSQVSTFCSPPLFSPSILMMCPLIILRFVILMLIWAMRITCFICLVGMLKLLSP